MGKTVAQLGAEMSSTELVEWMAIDQVTPFGDERNNLHAGLIAAQVAQGIGAVVGQGYQPPTTQNFLIEWPETPTQTKTDQEEMALLDGLCE